MKALSIWQPRASLIACGAKRIKSGVLLIRTVDDAPEQVETFFLERTAPCQTA